MKNSEFTCLIATYFFTTSCGNTLTSAANYQLSDTEKCSSSKPQFANKVVEAKGASGIIYGDPERAINGVRGAGIDMGSTDVFSLDKADDGILIIRWDKQLVCNIQGPDFSVFENGFANFQTGRIFFEPIIVSVSLDGLEYLEFTHQYKGTLAPIDLAKSSLWEGFAGMNTVLYNEETNNYSQHGIDPLRQDLSGGDSFDLDSLPDSESARTIKAKGFRFLKLQAAPAANFPNVPGSFDGFADIDGVYAARFSTDDKD